jgi:hypothetical protein
MSISQNEDGPREGKSADGRASKQSNCPKGAEETQLDSRSKQSTDPRETFRRQEEMADQGKVRNRRDQNNTTGHESQTNNIQRMAREMLIEVGQRPHLQTVPRSRKAEVGVRLNTMTIEAGLRLVTNPINQPKHAKTNVS